MIKNHPSDLSAKYPKNSGISSQSAQIGPGESGEQLVPDEFTEMIEIDPYPDDSDLTLEAIAKINPNPSIENPDSPLGQAVGLFIKKFGHPRRVLYPACGDHVIDQLFPQSAVVYVDPMELSIFAIRKGIRLNSRAFLSKIEDFEDSEQFDLLFSLNSHAPMEAQLSHLKENGYVFCNNYFGTQDAENIIKLGTCELVAIINNQSDDDQISFEIQTAGLDDYLAPCKREKDYYPQRKVLANYYIFRKLIE